MSKIWLPYSKPAHFVTNATCPTPVPAWTHFVVSAREMTEHPYAMLGLSQFWQERLHAWVLFFIP
jgi:hypothetical protein